MQQATKYYPSRYSCSKLIQAIVKWTPQFLETVERRFGLQGDFTAENITQTFCHILSANAARLKLLRLYRVGWFTRKQERGVYLYSFSNGAIRYYQIWNGFESEESPFVKARKPQVIRETIESQKETSDIYVGEL